MIWGISSGFPQVIEATAEGYSLEWIFMLMGVIARSIRSHGGNLEYVKAKLEEILPNICKIAQKWIELR